MQTIPILYVAGPYRADSRGEIQMNIMSALTVATKAIKKGWAPICPHQNFANLDEIMPAVPDQFWLDATMEFLRVSHAVVMAPGWPSSRGSVMEYQEAVDLSIPVFETVDSLPEASDFCNRRHLYRGGGPVKHSPYQKCFLCDGIGVDYRSGLDGPCFKCAGSGFVLAGG